VTTHARSRPLTSRGLRVVLWIIVSGLWAMIAFWLVALRDANHHNNKLASPLTQEAPAPAFPCSADALV